MCAKGTSGGSAYSKTPDSDSGAQFEASLRDQIGEMMGLLFDKIGRPTQEYAKCIGGESDLEQNTFHVEKSKQYQDYRKTGNLSIRQLIAILDLLRSSGRTDRHFSLGIVLLGKKILYNGTVR